MRSEPLRVELGEVRQQLVEAVQAREDMSEVWEQLLEGNARLRREKQLAWKMAEVCADKVPVEKDVEAMTEALQKAESWGRKSGHLQGF